MLIIWRGLHRIRRSGNMFIILAVGSILVQFGIQTLIHMGSSLQLLPAKGMTLPFISYGGSSLLAMAFALGMVLALTRKQTNTYAAGKARQSRAADIIKPSLKGAHT